MKQTDCRQGGSPIKCIQSLIDANKMSLDDLPPEAPTRNFLLGRIDAYKECLKILSKVRIEY